MYYVQMFKVLSSFHVIGPLEDMQKQEDDVGAQFTEKFLQDPENITLLLTMLEVG